MRRAATEAEQRAAAAEQRAEVARRTVAIAAKRDDPRYVTAAKRGSEVDRPGDSARAHIMRQRCEDVAVDRSRAVVVVCDRCEDQPLERSVSWCDVDLCLTCAGELRERS